MKAVFECNQTDVNTIDDDDVTPLYLAARKNQPEIVDYLLTIENIDVNRGTAENGETALIVAARHGNYKVTEELLLSQKIDVNKGLTTT